MSTKPVRIAITGAAGQVSYALLYRIASGEMFGKDQQVIPQMLELPLKWKAPKRIFVNSMSDLFHAEVPLPYIRDVFDIVRRAHLASIPSAH